MDGFTLHHLPRLPPLHRPFQIQPYHHPLRICLSHTKSSNHQNANESVCRGDPRRWKNNPHQCSKRNYLPSKTNFNTQIPQSHSHSNHHRHARLSSRPAPSPPSFIASETNPGNNLPSPPTPRRAACGVLHTSRIFVQCSGTSEADCGE